HQRAAEAPRRRLLERLDPAFVNGHDGESFRALIARVRAFLDRLAERPVDGEVAVFTHGIFMKAVLWSLLTGVTDPDRAAMRTSPRARWSSCGARAARTGGASWPVRRRTSPGRPARRAGSRTAPTRTAPTRTARLRTAAGASTPPPTSTDRD